MPERLARDPVRQLSVLFDPTLVASLALGSLLLLGVSAAFVPWILRRLPADYFLVPPPPPTATLYARLARIAKNVAGLLLLGLGLAMLVLPGQGLLTLLAAATLLDFPGRRRLLRRIFQQPRLRAAIDGWRRRGGVPPLRFEPPP